MKRLQILQGSIMLALWIATGFHPRPARCENDQSAYLLAFSRVIDTGSTRSLPSRIDALVVTFDKGSATTPTIKRKANAPPIRQKRRVVTPSIGLLHDAEKRIVEEHPLVKSLPQGQRIGPWGREAVLHDGRVLARAAIQIQGAPPDSKSAPCYHMLFLLDRNTSSVIHIAGSDKDRCFISITDWDDSLTDKYVTFYRIANYNSIMMGTEEDTREIADEGGWEVCCYDIEKRELRVLVKSAYRYGSYPQSPLLWSPDGSKLLYSGCYEPWGLDKVNNERLGVYIYERDNGTHRRLTKKYNGESAICWSPDSKRFLMEVNPNPYRPQDASDFGYWIVDTVSSAVTPLMLLDSKARTAKGLGDFRRIFAWSPDGKYIALCAAQFDETGAQYDGVFIMADDNTGRYWLVDKERINPAREPRLNRFFSDLVWLNP